MGAIKGSVTYTKYYVADEPTAGFRERFVACLEARHFREIDVEAGHDRSAGWVTLGDPFGTSLNWEDIFIDPYICISLREDSIRIPPTALKAYLDRRIQETCDRLGRDALRRAERAQIKTDVLLELRRRAIADIKLYDVVWNVQEGVIRLWSHSRRIRDIFEEIVSETWGIRIVPHAPYTSVANKSEDGTLAANILELDPADLAGLSEE